jgi:DNA-directed RNA polymerase II subunit RPB1
VFDSERDDPKKFHSNDRNVIIKRGELLVGTLSKRHVGHVRGSIVGCIWLDYGPDATKNFLSYAQRMINNWLLVRGFSVGIEDTVIEDDVFRDIKKKVEETQKEFAMTLQDTQMAQHKLIKHQPGKTILESFEVKVNGLLNDCGNQIGSLLNKNIRSDNNFNIMIESGSKGSNLNIRQICGLVGQVNVEGKRIPYGFKNRTLPHFMKDDLCPESKGFVSQSYFTGLSPEEFFFHTMGGREGLIDTAVKTSQTGYMQRRLVKAMEDVMVQYDSTVRDSYGAVVQFLYGEDGMAGEYIEEQKFDLADRSDEFIAKTCSFYEIDKGKADLGFIEQIQKLYEEEKITTAVRESLIENTNSHKILHEEYNQILSMRENMRELYLPDPKKASKHLPVNIERLITQAQFNISEKGRSDLNPIDVYSEVKKLTESLVIVPGTCDISRNANGNALKLFRYFVHYKLTSRKVILDYKLSSDAFRYLLNEIRERYQIAQVHPGEMVGSIGAQSLSETLTQMTLNTFHFAGVSDMNITLGVPRIQEIINCAKNIKDPSMTIFMKEEYRYNKEAAVKLMNLLEFTTVRDLAKCSEIYYDPDPNQTIIQADEDLVWGDPGDDSRQNWSPWLLRIEMEPAFLYRKDVKLDDIVRAIEKFFPPNSDRALDITTSLYTADLIVLRLRMKKRETDPEGSSNQYHDLKKIEKFILEDMAIKGLCPKVAYKQQKLNVYTQNGIEDENKASGGEFVLETRGSNLNKAFEFQAVDAYRTTTNHTMDIYEVLGIEAARNSILQEITLVLNFFGIYVNRRHINLLADVITASGKLMSISRNGINRIYHSALRKCSFEETVEILMEASANAELDEIKGVTENVMMGQLSKLGTGCFDVLMDKAYFFGENEADKNAIAEKWKYFPDQNPYNPVEEGMADDEQGGGIDTPHPQKTPGPGTDWMRTKTPNINAEFEHGNVFAQSPGIFTPTAMTPGYQSRGMTPRQPSPHSIIYSPYADKNFRK